MTVICVDHGEKRLGVSVSGPGDQVAVPLVVLRHRSRDEDAAAVAALANERRADTVVVGQSFDEEGLPNAAGRSAERFAEALKRHTNARVVLWDESLSTQDAREGARAAGGKRRYVRGSDDALAATVILQSYLDAKSHAG